MFKKLKSLMNYWGILNKYNGLMIFHILMKTKEKQFLKMNTIYCLSLDHEKWKCVGNNAYRAESRMNFEGLIF